MGITSLDVSEDGKEIVVGTMAAFGDPNVLVLDDTGKVVRHYKVGQRWIDDIAFLPGNKEVIALCTMPAGRPGDRVEAFRLKDGQVLPEKVLQEGPWFFHYGDHSNHPTMKARHAEWIRACRTSQPTSADFEYSGWLTEANHLGNVDRPLRVVRGGTEAR
jgi:hypothetical protein